MNESIVFFGLIIFDLYERQNDYNERFAIKGDLILSLFYLKEYLLNYIAPIFYIFCY